MKARITRLFSRFSTAQRKIFSRINTPAKVQDFIDYELDYNNDPADTCFSPLGVLKERRAHCIEGAMFAAAAFLFHGRPSLLLDLRADDTDDDHVIAPFRENGRWGAVAQSHFCGLRFREPVYGSIAELARSYFEFYYNEWGKKTLREFSAPLDTAALKPEWLYGTDAGFVGRKLDSVKHYRIQGTRRLHKLRMADSLFFEAEIIGAGRKPLTHRRPLPYSKLI
jgi:hypothetical protein